MIKKIPGFRTGKVWKSIIAVITYIIIGLLFISTTFGNTALDGIIVLIQMLVFIGIPYVIIFNLGNITAKLPFFKNGKKVSGYAFTFIVWFTIFISSILGLNGFHSQEYKADQQLRSEQRAQEKAEKEALKLAELELRKTENEHSMVETTKKNVDQKGQTSELPSKPAQSAENIIPATTVTAAPTSTPQPTPTNIPTIAPTPIKEDPIRINFSGQISPNIAKKGSKVVIKIDVENLDEKRSIEDVRLLFSNKKFIEDGLIVVNIMSGGVQDGNGFNWVNEGMKIPPKEKRSFQIVCQANKVGNYQSIIQIKPVDGVSPYSDPEGNEELNAKLTVIN